MLPHLRPAFVITSLAVAAVACGSKPGTGASTSSSSSSMSGTGGATSGTSGGGTGGVGSTSSTTSSATTSSATTSSSTEPCGVHGPAEILSPGTGGQILLRGVVATPDLVFPGEVLVTGDTITCVAASCPSTGAAVVDTHGVILPGLIDTHNHILFDIFDETDWSPSMSYTNHNQWTNEARYGALVDAKQYLNGEASSPVDLGCEMDKYGELKGLVAGTTAIVGAANPANRACYGSLARTVDQSSNGLGSDKVQVATLFPTTSAADGVCTNVGSGKTDAYLIHVGEGVDATALGEFAKLSSVTTTDGCLYDPRTTIVHGTAFGGPELDTMAMHGMSLTWSPRSNVFLYGAGTDLTRTANVPLALSKGINVALAPDWSIGGSQNLLDELRFADQVDNTVWGDQITPEMLAKMVTTHAAKALGLDAVIGSLAPGKKADILVIGGDTCAPFDALLAATPVEVRLTMVGGVALYGDLPLASLAQTTPPCENLDVCGTPKFACVAQKSSTSTDKMGQTFAEIQQALGDALTAYDAMNLSAWDFMPLTPIVRCSP